MKTDPKDFEMFSREKIWIEELKAPTVDYNKCSNFLALFYSMKYSGEIISTDKENQFYYVVYN